MITAVACAINVNAYDFIEDGLAYNKTSDNNLKLVGLSPFPSMNYHIKNLIVPDIVFHDGIEYIVTEIGDDAFCYCEDLISAVIPNTVKKIGVRSFASCINLETVDLGEGVTSTSTYSFIGCIKLKSLEIPSSLTYIGSLSFGNCASLDSICLPNVTQVCNNAFSGCNGLKSLVIGSGVKEIATNAFSSCSNLKNLYVDDCDEKLLINESAFSGCPIKNLYLGRNWNLYSSHLHNLEHLTIGEPVTVINFGAFSSCTLLEEVVISNRVKEIQNYAFYNCTGLKKVVLGDSVQYIRLEAFNGCTNLSTLVFNNQLMEIGEKAFKDCTSLGNLTFPESLKSIGNYAFANTLWTELVIPNTLNSIGFYAFKDCTSLQSIVIEDGTDYLSLKSNTITGDYGSPFIGCPINSVYMGRNIWHGDQSYFLTYDDSPFHAMETLTKLKIGNQVTVIHPYTFAGCNGLKSVVIPDNIQRIRFAAFSGCTGLELIYLGTGLTKIEDSAFNNCSLTTVYNASPIPASITINYTNPFSNYTLDNGILYVPIGTKSAYQSALYWKDFKNIEEFSEFNEELINYVAEYSAIEDVVVDKSQPSNNIGIYTIDGRFLGKKDTTSLSPGIYIINGRKVIVN